MALDLTSLHKAHTQLEGMWAYAQKPGVRGDAELAAYMDTALMQAFEFVYQLSHKFMRRFIEMQGVNMDADATPGFRTVLRRAHEYGLIREVEAWMDYRDKRNVVAHTYDAQKIAPVLAILPAFLEDSRFLLEKLRARGKEES